MRNSVIVVFLSVVALAVAVPTPERLEALRKRRTEDDHPSFPFERVSSVGRLFTQDAHRIYRKSFEGLAVDDMDAMLEQLFQGQVRLWGELSQFLGDGEDDSEEAEDEEGGEDVFSQLVAQLQMDPETMSTLLSGTDRLEVDGRRMECMMELLNQLSGRIRQALGQLQEDSGSWIRRLVIRQIRSAMQAMLRVIDSIRTTMEDAEVEVAVEEEEAEIEAEESEEETKESSDETQEQDSPIDLDNVEEVGGEADAGPEVIQLRDQYKFREDAIFSRRKRSTVTSQFRSTGYGMRRHRGGSRYKFLRGGWDMTNSGLTWTNRRRY